MLPVHVRQQNTSRFSKCSAFHSGELLLAHVVRCVLTLARLNGCEFLRIHRSSGHVSGDAVCF